MTTPGAGQQPADTVTARPQSFEVDGHRFDDVDGVIRYLVDGHSRKDLIALLIANLNAGVAAEARLAEAEAILAKWMAGQNRLAADLTERFLAAGAGEGGGTDG